MSAQYGKNHLGDRDEHLPTNHGFDEFMGNLYHLNAEEEPENPDYPTNFVFEDGTPFKERFGPRGVIKSTADGKIEDTGPLTKKRMETIDEEVTAGALNFIDRAHSADKPFFLWWNSTRMHVWTHLKPESEGVTGMGIYPDGMVEHDGMVGEILDKLDELGIADQHHCHVLDRQRCRGNVLAGWWHDAHSAARRTPTGRAAIGYLRSSGGRESSSPELSSTR